MVRTGSGNKVGRRRQSGKGGVIGRFIDTHRENGSVGVAGVMDGGRGVVDDVVAGDGEKGQESDQQENDQQESDQQESGQLELGDVVLARARAGGAGNATERCNAMQYSWRGR